MVARSAALVAVLVGSAVPAAGFRAPSPGPTHRSPPSLAAAQRTPRVVASLPPPPEVIEAEANATPNRKYRMGGAATLGLLALASGGLAVASLAGQEDALAIGQDVLLFGNPYLSLLVDVVVGGASAWAFQQELVTKEQNIARIWEEVQRRRNGPSGAAPSGSNRSQRRSESKTKRRPEGFQVGSQAGPPPPPPPPPPPSAPPPLPSPSTLEEAPPTGGLLGGLSTSAQSLFAEANAMGRANALQLNSELEKRGVLPELEKPEPVTEPGAAAGPEGEGVTSADVVVEHAEVEKEAETVRASAGGKTKTGAKKKGKQGKKRK